MGKNLAGKTAFIVAVLVVFVYGIFGIPKGGLKQAITNRIHLGLDLKGGTHLVLEVHVNEAVASAVDRDAVRLTTDLQAAGISGAAFRGTWTPYATASAATGCRARSIRRSDLRRAPW